MKKKFTFLMAACMLLTMMVLPGKTWAETSTVTASKITSSSVSWNGSANETWSVTVNGGATNQNVNNGYAQVGTSSSPSTSVTFSTSGISGTISSIVVNCAAYQGKATISATVGGSAFGTQSQSVPSWSSNTGGNVTFSGSASGAIVITMTNGTGGKAMYIKSITVTYTTGGGSSAVETTTEITVPSDFNTDLKNGTPAGTLSAAVTETESGDEIDGATVTWKSSDPDVATINESGEVTLVAVGTTTITANYAGVTDEYEASSDKYELEVVDSRYTVSDLTFTAACGGSGTADDGAEWEITSDADESNFDSNRGIHYGTSNANVTYVRLTTTDIEGIIKRVVINASDAQGASTISVTVGGEAFTCTGSTTVTNSNPGVDYTFNGSGNGEIVVLLDRGNAQTKAIYVKSVKVTYQEVAVKDPVINVPDSFVGSTTATITCETVGANIKYNYDGGSTWNTYTTGLTITETTTIYAKAVKDEDESSVVSKTTTKNYNVNIDNLTHGTITATPTVAAEGDEITLTITPAGCYQLKSGTLVVMDDESNEITVTNNKFNMPGSDVLVSAEFEIIKYTVQYSVNGTIEDALEDIVSCGSEASLWDEDDLESEGIEIPSGYTFAGWSTSASSNDVVSSYTPEANATLFAVLVGNVVTKTYSFTISTSDFNKTSYAANDGDHTSVATATTGETMNVTWTTSNVMLSNDSESIQWRKSPAGSLSATNLGTIISVDIDETSSNALTLNISGDSFSITDKGDATGYASTVEVVFEKNTTPSYTLVEDVTGTQNIASVEASHLITVKNGGVLTLTGTNNGTAANLIIEDGGQLILDDENTGVQATVQKTTAASEAKTTNNWYAISSPVNNVTVASIAQTSTYNMYYYYEPTHYWMNDKVLEDPDNPESEVIEAFTTLTNGRGYLYRSTKAGINFVGDVNVADAEYPLTYTAKAGSLKGFHLIGNPYTHDIYKGTGGAIENILKNEDPLEDITLLEDGFYTLLADGSWDPKEDNTDAIAPGQGVLVQTTSAADGETLTITNKTTGGPAKYGNDRIMFHVENSEYSDNSFVLFKEGHGLNKIEHRNDEIPMLYVMNNGESFAIADMPDNTSVINLGFEAKTMGKYTISLKAEGQYSYMHLFDKLTGEDIDMLVEDSYTFVGSQNDRKDRFVLRLNYNAAGIDSESDIFAYQSGNDIIVSGEGELQVFDITGRKVMTMNVNGVETVNGFNKGVYIFRMEGKTQKIVIR